MNATQIGGAIALAVIGLLLIVVSSISRDSFNNSLTIFADHLSKAGIFLGASFMLPLLIMLLVGIVVGFQ